jgi:hypothetical protein
MNESYSHAVVQLQGLGEAAARARPWPDYLSFGIEATHIPELVRLVCDAPRLWSEDESDGADAWTPIHAWRALGQLQATSAVEPLVECLAEFVDADWAMNELPTVFAMIGRAAIPALGRTLMDASHELWTRAAAADSLREIAVAHPESREEAVAALLLQMEKWYRTDEVLNALLIGDLVDLKVREAVPLIEKAFAEDRVDPTIVGDWEDVQVELGLLPEGHAPRTLLPPLLPLDLRRELAPEEPHGRGASKKKAKRRMAKESRKRNRRRR